MNPEFRPWLILAIAALTVSFADVAHAAWPSLAAPAQASGGGSRDAAVIVGIGDYFVAPDIPGAQKNATDWYTHLVRGRQVPADRVTLLRNKEGTREKILKALRDAASRTQEGGTLWFVFIGHGAPGRQGRQGVLVGADAQADVESLYSRSIQQSEIIEAISGAHGRAVVVVDACFSGRTSSDEPLIPGLQPLLPVAAQSQPPAGLTFFTAGTSDQFAGGLPGAKRPAFSYLLLGALRGWADANKDGEITAREAALHTRVALATVLKDRAQTPVLWSSEPETVLSIGREEGPALSAMVLEKDFAEVAETQDTLFAKVRLEARDSGTYNLSVIDHTGKLHTCQHLAERGQPCTISGVPVGKSRIRVDGNITLDQEINLGHERVVVSADGAESWTGWTSIGLMTAGFVSSLLGVASLDNAADDPSILLLAGVPVFYTAGIVFGIVWLVDKDESATQRYDLDTPSSQPTGLRGVPSSDGLALRMQWQW